MPRDRMETVLRLRQLREREARTELGRAAVAVHDADAALADARAALRGHVVHAGDVVQLLLARTVAVGLQEAVGRAEQARAAAVATHRSATEAWRESRAEERAVERLVERRRATALAARFAAEQQRADELALFARSAS